MTSTTAAATHSVDMTSTEPNSVDETANQRAEDKNITRRLRWYLISSTLDFVGLSICLSILPFVAVELGATGIGVGMIFSSFSVGMTLGSAMFGKLSDVRGRRCAVIASTVATVISYVLCGLASTYWQLFAARVFSGLAAGSMAITNSVIIDLVPEPQRRPKYTGMLGACQGLAIFLGPALAALLAPLGFQATFFVTAVLSSAGLVGVCLFAEETMDSTASGAATAVQGKQQADSGAPATRWSALVYVPMGAMFLGSNNFAIMNATHALLMQHNFGWGVVETSMLMASVGAGQIVMQALIVKRVVKAVGPTAALMLGCGLMTLGMSLYPFMPTWQLSVAFFFLYMLAGFSFLLPVVPLVVADMVPKKDTGKAMGLTLSAFAMGRITGPAIGGALWDESRAMPFWVGIGATAAATLLVAALVAHSVRTKCVGAPELPVKPAKTAATEDEGNDSDADSDAVTTVNSESADGDVDDSPV